MKKRKILFIGILIILSWIYWSDYREEDLDDVIRLKTSDFVYLGFTKNKNDLTEGKDYEWSTDNVEAAKELLDFLSQYQVKKQRKNFFDPNYVGDRFEFLISHDQSNPTIVFGEENYVHILNGNYYKVINGPIDIEWLNTFNEKYK